MRAPPTSRGRADTRFSCLWTSLSPTSWRSLGRAWQATRRADCQVAAWGRRWLHQLNRSSCSLKQLSCFKAPHQTRPVSMSHTLCPTFTRRTAVPLPTPPVTQKPYVHACQRSPSVFARIVLKSLSSLRSSNYHHRLAGRPRPLPLPLTQLNLLESVRLNTPPFSPHHSPAPTSSVSHAIVAKFSNAPVTAGRASRCAAGGRA